MTDPDEHPDAPTSADDLTEAVSGLGESPEDQLQTVAERNDSLEERLGIEPVASAEDGSPKHG